jgi:hypothetical protein
VNGSFPLCPRTPDFPPLTSIPNLPSSIPSSPPFAHILLPIQPHPLTVRAPLPQVQDPPFKYTPTPKTTTFLRIEEGTPAPAVVPGAPRKPRRSWRAWGLIPGALLIAAGAFIWLRPGVKLVVRNSGGAVLRDVHIGVTGRTYALPDIPPNGSKTVRLHPTGDSGITIHHEDATGRAEAVEVDCYLGSGYSGRISVEVADGTVTRQLDNIR